MTVSIDPHETTYAQGTEECKNFKLHEIKIFLQYDSGLKYESYDYNIVQC